MRHSIIAATTLSLTTLFAIAPADAQLRAYAGVVAGNAAFGPRFECATSGPTIGSPWFAGLSLPLEGFAPCGLGGMIDDKTAATGPISAAATGTGPMANVGTYTGTATAIANYWNLGVSSAGTATGDVMTATYHQSAAYASFVDNNVIFTSPTHANGTPGFANFTMLIEGMMKNIVSGPYSEQSDIAVSFLVNGRLWTSFIGTTLGGDTPFIRGGATNIPGNFVSTPGGFSGSDLFTTNSNFDIVYGVPLRVEVAMYSSVYPCCFNSSSNVNFSNTLTLKGVDVFAFDGKVTDFLMTTGSGLRVNANGIIQDVPPSTTAPEPSTFASALIGLIGIAYVSRRIREAVVTPLSEKETSSSTRA